MPDMIGPPDAAQDELVLSHFSLSPHHPIEDRIEAAKQAGFSAIGLYIGDYRRHLASGLAPTGLQELLHDADLRLAEIEVLSGWAQDRPSDDYWETERLAWAIADDFGSRYVQAIGPYTGSISDAAAAFAGLCDRAADHGLVVGLEFLPFTNIADAHDALRIVQDANRPNGGVCVDIWHHVRGRNDMDLIRAIPGELITGIQMNDGTLRPVMSDYKQDCLTWRVPPGEGEFDITGVVGALLDAGVDVPWSLEVCNAEAWEHDAHGHVRRCADGMRTALAAARSSRRNRETDHP